MSVKSFAFLALATGFASIANAQKASGSGKTTRYWDCCKASCSWKNKFTAAVSGMGAINQCDAKGNKLALGDDMQKSGCDGGSAFMCADQTPEIISPSVAYGFAAVSLAGEDEKTNCCSCFELTFKDTAVAGKTLVVQVSNTGNDLSGDQFDLAIPSGGVGQYNGCATQLGTSADLGAQYGGITRSDQCANYGILKPGCDFRFGTWWNNADNPSMDWKRVACPDTLTKKSGCKRSDEAGLPAAAGAGSAPAPAPAPSSSSYQAPAPIPTSATYEAPAPAPSSSSYEAPAPAPAPSSSSYVAPGAPAPTDASPSAYPTTSATGAAYPTTTDSEDTPEPTGSDDEPSAPSSGSPASPEPTFPAAPANDCPVQYVYEYDE